MKSLKTREKQLLRQLEAVHNQQLSIVQLNWELLPSVPSVNVNLDNWQSLNETILKFGRLELPDQDGIVINDAEPYKVEEYEEASKDHVSFDKSIKIENDNDIIINIPSPSLEKKIHLLASNNNCTMEFLNSSNNDKLNGSIETGKNLQLDTASNHVSIFGDHDYLPLCLSTDLIEQKNSTVDEILVKSQDTKKNEEIIKRKCQEQDMSIDDVDLKEINLNDDKKKQDNDEHPKQIQEWLEQILVETETEPAIHEIQQFAEISNTLYKEFEFQLKT